MNSAGDRESSGRFLEIEIGKIETTKQKKKSNNLNFESIVIFLRGMLEQLSSRAPLNKHFGLWPACDNFLSQAYA